MNLFSLTHVGIVHDKAISLINNVFTDLLTDIDYTLKDYISAEVLQKCEEQLESDFQIEGAYCRDTKRIFLCKRSTIRTAIHEIGHAVHHQLFNFEDFNLSKENRTERATLNHREDFAEAFADVVLRCNEGTNLKTRDFEVREILLRE
ncbi:hypothetical protein LUM37_02780 [Bacillus subtilis]|nr:hypothetical protein LUM37_02780 [Bacillus subtilis]